MKTKITKNKIDTYVLRSGKALLVILILATLVKGAFAWGEFNTDYKFHFIYIEPRQTPINHTLVKEAEAKPVDPTTLSTEDYICYVFGKDCKMALAVSQAENGTRKCDRFGVNTNKTIDFGVFQINTVHLKKGWTVAELIDCHKNIDYAYEIYQAQGWHPWVAYQNGNYKQYLK